MGNAERFLDAYNGLDKFFDSQLPYEVWGFEKKIMNLERNERFGGILRRFGRQLRAINELRNVIVHGDIDEGRYIADPRENVIELLEYIFSELTKPKTVFDARSPVSPVIFDYEQLLFMALRYMNENDFSQVIVFLRREDTAKWLEKMAMRGLLDISGFKISDILSADCNNKCHISKNATVYEALEIFQKSGFSYPALIINQSGKDNEEPLGILTPMDLIDYVSITSPSVL
jgi:hypothetical protein